MFSELPFDKLRVTAFVRTCTEACQAELVEALMDKEQKDEVSDPPISSR